MKWIWHLLGLTLITHLGASGTMLKCGEDIVVGRGGKKNLRFWSSDDELLKVEVIPSAPPRKSNDGSAILSIFKNVPNSGGLIRQQELKPSLRIHDEGEEVGPMGEGPSAFRTSDQKIIPRPPPTEDASLDPSVMTQDTDDLFEPEVRDETIAAIRSKLSKLKEGTYDPEKIDEALESIKTRLNVLKGGSHTALQANDPTKYEEIDIPAIDHQDQENEELDIKLRNEALKSNIDQEIIRLKEQVYNLNQPSGNIAVIRNQIVKLLGDIAPSEHEASKDVGPGIQAQQFDESEIDGSQSVSLGAINDNETVPAHTNSQVTKIEIDSSQIEKANKPFDSIDTDITTKSEIKETYSGHEKEHQPDEREDQITKHDIDPIMQVEPQADIIEDQSMKFVSGPVLFDQHNKPYIDSSKNHINLEKEEVSTNQENEPSSVISNGEKTKFVDGMKQATQKGNDHLEISTVNDQTIMAETDAIPIGQEDKHTSGIYDGEVTEFEVDDEQTTQQGQHNTENSNDETMKDEADLIATGEQNEHSSVTSNDEKTKFEDGDEKTTQQGQHHSEINNDESIKAEADVILTSEQNEHSSDTSNNEDTKFEDDDEQTTQQGQHHTKISNDETMKAEADVILTGKQNEHSSGTINGEETKFEDYDKQITQQGQHNTEISNDETMKAEADVTLTGVQNEHSSGTSNGEETKFKVDNEKTTQQGQHHTEISNDETMKAEDVILTGEENEHSSGTSYGEETKSEDDDEQTTQQNQHNTGVINDETIKAEADVILTGDQNDHSSATSNGEETRFEADNEQTTQQGQHHGEINDETMKAEDVILTSEKSEQSSSTSNGEETKSEDDKKQSTPHGQGHSELNTGNKQPVKTEADAIPASQQDVLSSDISDGKVNKYEDDPEHSIHASEDHIKLSIDQTSEAEGNLIPTSQMNTHSSDIGDDVITYEDKAQSAHQGQDHSKISNDKTIKSNADAIPIDLQAKPSSDTSVESITKSKVHTEHSSQDNQEPIEISHEMGSVSKADPLHAIKSDKPQIEIYNEQAYKSDDKREEAGIDLLQQKKTQGVPTSEEERVKVLLEQTTKSDMSHAAITIPKDFLMSNKNKKEETLKTDTVALNENIEININENSDEPKVEISDSVKLEEPQSIPNSEMENMQQELGLVDKIMDSHSPLATKIRDQIKSSEVTGKIAEKSHTEINIPTNFLKFFQKGNKVNNDKVDEKDESSDKNSGSQTEDVKQNFNKADTTKPDATVAELIHPDTEIASDSQHLDDATVNKSESEDVTQKDAISTDHDYEGTSVPEFESSLKHVGNQEMTRVIQPIEQSEISGQVITKMANNNQHLKDVTMSKFESENNTQKDAISVDHDLKDTSAPEFESSVENVSHQEMTGDSQPIEHSEINGQDITQMASDSQQLGDVTVSKLESDNDMQKDAISVDHDLKETSAPEFESIVKKVSHQEMTGGSQPIDQSEIDVQDITENDSHNHNLGDPHSTISEQENSDLASDPTVPDDSDNADYIYPFIDTPLLKPGAVDLEQNITTNKTLEEETNGEIDSKKEDDIEPAAMIVPEPDILYPGLSNEGVIDYSHYTDASHLPNFESGFSDFDQYDSNFNDYGQKHNIKADSINSDELPILNSNKDIEYIDTVKLKMDSIHSNERHSEVESSDPIKVTEQMNDYNDFTHIVSSGQSEALPETQEDKTESALQNNKPLLNKENFEKQDEQSITTQADLTTKISNAAEIQAEIVRLIEGTLSHVLTNTEGDESSSNDSKSQATSAVHQDVSERQDTSSTPQDFSQETSESSFDVNKNQEFSTDSQVLNTKSEGEPLGWKLSEILTKLNKKGNEPGDTATNPIEIYPEDIGYNEDQKDKIDANINILKSIVNQVATDLAVNRKETESKVEADLKPINLVFNPDNEGTLNEHLGVIDYDSKVSDLEEGSKIDASNVLLTGEKDERTKQAASTQKTESHVLENISIENKDVFGETIKADQNKESNNEKLNVKVQQINTDNEDNESLLTMKVEKQGEEAINIQSPLLVREKHFEAVQSDKDSRFREESIKTEESTIENIFVTNNNEKKQITTELPDDNKFIKVNDNKHEVISIPFGFLNWAGKESESKKETDDEVNESTGEQQDTLTSVTTILGFSENTSDRNAADTETTISTSIHELKDLNIMKGDSVFSKESGTESMISLIRESANKQKGNLEGDKNTISIPFVLSNLKKDNEPEFRINPVIIKEHESKVVIVTPNSNAPDGGAKIDPDISRMETSSTIVSEAEDVTTTSPIIDVGNHSNQESKLATLSLSESSPPSSAENLDYITDFDKSEMNDSSDDSVNYVTVSPNNKLNINEFTPQYNPETKLEISELVRPSEKSGESPAQSEAKLATETATKDPNFLTLLENYVIDESPGNSYIPEEIYNTEINDNYHEINNGNQDYHSIPINKFFFNNNDYENVRRRIDENTQDSAPQHEITSNNDRMPNQFERRHDNLPPSDIYQSGHRGSSLSSLLQTRKGFVGPSPDYGQGGAQVRKDDSQYPYGGDNPFFIKLPGSPNAVPVFLQYEPVEIKYVDADKLPKKTVAAKKEHPAFPLFKKNVVSGSHLRQNANEASFERENENDSKKSENVDTLKSKPDPFFIMEAPDLGKEHGPTDSISSQVKPESVTHGSSDSLTIDLKGQLNFDKPNSVPSTITGDRPVYPGQHFIKNPDNSYSSSDTATLTNPIFSLGPNGYVPSTTPGNPQYTPFPLTTNPPKKDASQEPTTAFPKTDPVPIETTIIDSTTLTTPQALLENEDSKNNRTEDPLSIDYSPIPFIMYNESFDAISYPDLPMTERLRDNFGILNQDKENFEMEMEDKKEIIPDEQGVGMFASPKSGLPPKDEDFDIVALANFLHQNQKVWSKNDMAQIPESGSWRDPLWDNVKYSNAHMEDTWSQPLGDSPWLSHDEGASSARDYTAFYSPEEIPGLDPLYFSYRQMSPSNREPRAQEAGVEGIKEFIETLPIPLKRAVVGDSPTIERTRRSTAIGEQIFCEWNFKTEPGLYLLVTFQNLSAPFTVDCYGAYIEVERESNGYGARWCGNRASLTGRRQHVIFAKHQVRISVYDNGDLARMQPTGFEAEIEAIDLFDTEEYDSFMKSKANSKLRRLMEG